MGLMGLASVMSGCASHPSSAAERIVVDKQRHPNVVFIVTDDLGWNDVGCYSDDARVKTPNIDKLAEQGMRFTNAHAPASICTPSRFSLLTGTYCWRTWLKRSVIANTPLLIQPDSETLPSLFKDNGYKTACIGKWHLGTRTTPPGQFDPQTHFIPPIRPGPNEVGFDYFFGLPVGHFYPPYIYLENHDIYNYDPDDPVKLVRDKKAGHRGYLQEGGQAARYQPEEVLPDITRQAVKYVHDHKDERFFLYFATSSPHDPYTPSARFKGKSELGDYGDFMMETDWAVGEIVKAVKQSGIENETLIIFTSDNGGEDAERPAFKKFSFNPNGKWRGDKGDIYEGGLRIPFIARWPGVIKAGEESNQLFGFNDMSATFAGLLSKELAASAGPDSYNVFDAFLGTESLNRERGLVLHSRGGMFAVIRGDWKYIHGQGNGEFTKGWHPAPDESTKGRLFNLKEDPYETDDVITTYPEMATELQAILKKYYLDGRSR